MKPLLHVTLNGPASDAAIQHVKAHIKPIADKLGAELIVSTDALSVRVQQDLQPLVDAIARQTFAMERLVEVLGQ